MKRPPTPFKSILVLLLVGLATSVLAQTKYWTGGHGAWNDPAHWSLSAQGPGGAGVPRVNEDVVVRAEVPLTIEVPNTAWCKSMSVDATAASVNIVGGAAADINIAGDWRLNGAVEWNATGPVNLIVRRAGVEVDLRGRSIAGDIVLAGSGSWSVLSDLNTAGTLRLKEGTLMANNARIQAAALHLEGNGRKQFLAGNAIVALDQGPASAALNAVLRPGTSTLVVNGAAQPWPIEAQPLRDTDRDVNVCGTGPGQTPFTVTSQVVTNYNGFGVRCRGACDATVTVAPSGGSGTFSYQWLNGGPNTQTWTTACGGPQLVIVTDVVQGISCPVQVNVLEPAPIGVIFFGQGTPPTCADVCDGSRTALAIGGVSPSTYDWNNGAGANSSFFALCAGENTLLITDANLCTYDTTFTFNLAPIIPNLTFVNSGCFGECSGSATVAPTGGTGGFDIVWSPPPPVGQNTTTASGLCAGDWSVNVRDANGCDTTVTFTITEPPPIVPNVVSTPASCFGACDGTATVTPTGSAGPFDFVWSPAPGTGQGTGNVTGLCAQAYTVLITDQPSGCDTLVTVTIDAPPAIDVQGAVTDASCSDTCDGSIDLVVTGGNGAFTYLWVPVPPIGQGTPSVSQLCPGDWSVTVADGSGCDTTLTFTVNAPPPVVATVTTTDVTCAGACDGTAEVEPSGGVGGFTFNWVPAPPVGQGTAAVSGLCAGEYDVTVSDANGCDTTITFTINEPLPLVVVPSQTNLTCGTICDGTASVAVSGGTQDYTYLWTPAPQQGQGTATASGLCAGPISVLITDANGCTVTQDYIILDAVPIQLSLQLVPASCPNTCDGEAGVIATGGVAAYTYFWDPAPGAGQGTATVTGLCPQAYSLTVTDAVGCDTTISFTISAPEPILPNPTQTDVTCAGDANGTIVLAPTGGNGTYTYNWVPTPQFGQGSPNAGGLFAGDWTVTITSGLCDTTITITILEPLPIVVDLLTTDATCSDLCDGTATPTASGGTGPLTYFWSPPPGAGQGTPNATGFCPGNYTLVVADAAGCDTTISLTINAAPPILPGLVTTPETCDGPCTGTASVAPIGGTGTITASWSPQPGGGQGTFNATGLCANTTYTVTLSDANSCDTTLTFTILPSATIVPNSSSTPVSCAGLCDGTATVGPTGGVEPYTYVWSPPPTTGQGTPSATGFCAGTVQVTITDAEQCSIVAEILILEPPPILANATVTDPLCAGVCNGSIVLNTIGGDGNYTYVWSPNPPNGQGTNTITGLCAGTWNVTITDGSGCSATSSHTVVEPAPLTLSVVNEPSQCQVCVGTATATAGGGTGLLTIEWRDGSGTSIGTGATIAALCAGVYTATVTDANGCTLQQTVPITDSDGEDITANDGATTCPNTCDGSVSVSFTCVDGPCSIAWSDALGNDLGVTTDTISGLCPGEYYVSVTNGSGCVTVDTATVVPAITTVLSLSSTPVSCTGECDGTATVGIGGGPPPYTIIWSPPPGQGQGTPTVSGLCAGVYEVTVGDGAGCLTTAEVLITEPPPINVVSAIVIDIACSGGCDGNITLLATGGNGTLNYQWTPAPATGQGSPAAFGFCEGNVSVVISDANGCSITRTYVVEEPQPLQVSVSTTQSTCPNCDGTASVTVTGGTPGYTFSWVLGGVEVSADQSPTGLCGGVYSLTVRDLFGCFVQEVVEVMDSNAEVLDMVNGLKLCGTDCTGEVAVNYVCSAPPCTTIWTDVDGNVLAQNVDVLSNLCEGDYTVQVTNDNGCVSIGVASVTPSQTIVPNVSSTPASCAGSCDGTATVGPVGGVEPYTFLWTPAVDGQGTPQATGLCAGVYEVLITDSTGCDTTAQVLILEPQPLSLQAVIADASCNAECDGSIVVTPAGGTGTYVYNWTPLPTNGQGNNGALDLCAGDYQLLITDAGGCTLDTTFTVNEPDPLVLVGGSVSSECGVCDGEAFVSVSGGTPTYTYLWTLGGAIFGTADSLQALCAGLYDVLVTDDAGCQAALLVPVQDLNGEVITTTGDTTSCPGVCDGTVFVDFTCGTPDCTVAWFDLAGNDLGQTGNVVSGLCAGSYIVVVTNGTGCLSIDTALVTSPPALVPNLSTTPETCFGACDGTATVGPTGGVEPYDYAWDPAPTTGQGTPAALGLCAGVNQVTITDGAGCITVVPVLILGPPLLTADVTVTPITCNGACDGSIIVTPVGGTGPYTYDWITEPPNGPGSNSGTDLCAGDWIVRVIDFNGCDTTYTITLVDPPLLEAQLTTTDNICFGECIGTAAATITGGVAPYTVIWLDANNAAIAQDTTDISALCAGDYSLSITDSTGCTLLVPFTITQGVAIEASLVFTGETCFGPCDGTAAVSPIGGAGSFVFLWEPEPIPGQGTDQVTGLCAGNYTVTITDALSCDTTLAFTLLPYTPISDNETITDVLCNGACDGSVVTTATGGIGTLTYDWSPEPQVGEGTGTASSLCPDTYVLTITDQAGCDSVFTYTVTEPIALVVNVDQVTSASCADASDGAIGTTAFGGQPSYLFDWEGSGGFTSTAEDITGLAPGEYVLTLTDANNCVLVDTITVEALSTVVADAGGDQQICTGTSVTLDGTNSVGAGSYSWTDDQGNVIGTTATLTIDLPSPGDFTYTLTVTDGPCSSSDEVVISSLALPIADAGEDQTIFLSETATLGGVPSGPVGSTFTWAPDSLLTSTTDPNPVADPTTTTLFTLTVVAPNGCIDTDTVLVTVVPTVVIPNGFTPNADGSNDVWIIDFIDLFPDCEVEVYNRWGDQLFRSIGYNKPWDGKYRDGFVPVGTYYYVIELNDDRFPEPYTGPLTVIR